VPRPTPPVGPFGRTRRLCGALVMVALLVAGCAQAPAPAPVNDPFEATNRAWFDNNLALDRALSGGAPPREGPSPLRRMVRNFADNLAIPSTVLNDLLQLRPDRAAENTLRFAINSTVGLAGLFDPAGAVDLHGRRSDFGETLHRWGVGEGAYLVLPVLGPSTERDAVGMVVDAMLSPWDYVVSGPERRAITVARFAGRLADRAEFADLIDANVMQTADPYAQSRLLFLQARRYHLGIQTEDDTFDPYDLLD
jgi:phospholipid-binding lipoprotein MlaA